MAVGLFEIKHLICTMYFTGSFYCRIYFIRCFVYKFKIKLLPITVLPLFITLTLIIIAVYAFHRFWKRSENRVLNSQQF